MFDVTFIDQDTDRGIACVRLPGLPQTGDRIELRTVESGIGVCTRWYASGWARTWGIRPDVVGSQVPTVSIYLVKGTD